MTRRKQELLGEADTLGLNAVRLREYLNSAVACSTDIHKELEVLNLRYKEIVELPTWPVDAAVRKHLTIYNGLLALPFVLKSLGVKGGFSGPIDVLSKLFKG